MYVFPVPGGPWMTANSRVKANLNASSWEVSSPNTASGHCFVSNTGNGKSSDSKGTVYIVSGDRYAGGFVFVCNLK